jgi:hypothetical protein
MSDKLTNGMEFINQDFRGDNHPPLGDHLNFEVKLNLRGAKDGRQVNLSNTHITLGDD